MCRRPTSALTKDHGLGDGHLLDAYAPYGDRGGDRQAADLGGSHGRKEATGRGVIRVRHALQKLKMKCEGCRVIIQGFGNVGSMPACCCMRRDTGLRASRIFMARSLTRTASIFQSCIDWVYAQHKPLPEFPGGGEKMSAQDLLFQPCDILIPAATENQITTRECTSGQTRILCEGANGPTTPRPTKLSRRTAFSSCRIFWRMRAA